MALRHRRGVYTDFDPSKMVSGELASVQSGDPNTTSGQAVYACQNTGTVKRLAFVEDIQSAVSAATEDVEEEIIQAVSASVTRAETAANNAAASAASAAQHVTRFTDPNSDGNIVITVGGS